MATQPRVFYQKLSSKKGNEIHGKNLFFDPVNIFFFVKAEFPWKPEDPDPNS
jgi:hypothetical protein